MNHPNVTTVYDLGIGLSHCDSPPAIAAMFDRWERAYAAGRVTSIDSLIKDIDRTVGKG